MIFIYVEALCVARKGEMKYEYKNLIGEILNVGIILSVSLSLSEAQQPNAAQGRLMLEVSISHTMTHDSRWGFSGRGIGPSQRPLPDKTQLSKRQTSMPSLGFELSSIRVAWIGVKIFLET